MKAFYDLTKQERIDVVATISNDICTALHTEQLNKLIEYFGNDDTYIRKSAYLAIGKIYFYNKKLQPKIIHTLEGLFLQNDFKIRQAVINAAGEIGKIDFEIIRRFFDKGLFDKHHSPRNAVIGSIKKMGEVNPVPVLGWAKIICTTKTQRSAGKFAMVSNSGDGNTRRISYQY